jgi:hypothetical protein
MAVPAPFSLEGFRARLERHRGRVVLLVPVAMEQGAPSGTSVQTAYADYLYYESQTSPFHQAHIVLHLAACMLLGDRQGMTVDPRLVPDVSPRLLSLMVGEAARERVTHMEAEIFAFLVLQQAGCTLSGSSARRSLRQLEPLRAAVLDAVPAAARTAASGVSLAAQFRLHRTVVEIRDAALALNAYQDPQVATAATTAARAAGLTGDDAAAAVEAAILAGSLRAVKAGQPGSSKPGGTGLPPMLRPDLRSETAWLLKVSRALARSPLDGEPGRNDPLDSPRERPRVIRGHRLLTIALRGRGRPC